ncbi:MAG: acyl carrier protein [Solirubrobacteraceae bacterium]
MADTVTDEQVQSVVFESLQTFGADSEAIDREASFESLDVDSLDLAELSQIVEDRFGIELKGSDVAGVRTVGDAIDMILEKAS